MLQGLKWAMHAQYEVRHLKGISYKHIGINVSSSGTSTSVSLAFSTAVTVSGVKSRWRGGEEQQSSFHSSTSCSSSALTGGSDPEPGPTTTPSPPLRPDRDTTGSSADTEQTHTTGTQVCTPPRLYVASTSAAHRHLNNIAYEVVALMGINKFTVNPLHVVNVIKSLSISLDSLTQFAGQKNSRVQEHLLWHHSWELCEVKR